MKKLVSLIIAVTMLLLIAGEVSAKKYVVCYRVMNCTANIGPGSTCEPVEFTEVYKLNIKTHSPIFTKEETTTLGHQKQFVYSVHGKHVGVCGRIPPRLSCLRQAGRGNPYHYRYRQKPVKGGG